MNTRADSSQQPAGRVRRHDPSQIIDNGTGVGKTPVILFALTSALLFVLSATPIRQTPHPGSAERAGTDPSHAISRVAAGTALQTAPATPYVSVTPSPLPVSVLTNRQL